MPQRIRDAQVAEEIAAQAGADATPDLFLSDFLSPVIFGPQRPPLASSGYFPGCAGVFSAAVALNTSHAGIFVSGTNVDIVVRVNSILIMNLGAAAESYTVRRLDDATGFTVAALVPGYISAGNPNTLGVQSAVRNNAVAASGVSMGQVTVPITENMLLHGPWVLNNGALVVAPNNINTQVRVYMNYEAWPSIRPQPIPG